MRLGLIVPPVRIRDNMQLHPNEYVIKLKEIEVARYELMVDHLLAMNMGLASEELPGIPTREPAFGLEAIWISPNMKERAEMLNYTVVDACTVLATHLSEVIKRHAHELLSRQTVHNMLEMLKKDEPAVVEELVPQILSLGDVHIVLRNLLRERVPIRNLSLILETLADCGRRTKDHDVLTEYVRNALSKYICAEYVDENGEMRVMTLDPVVEKEIANSLTELQGSTYLGLEPQRMQEIIAAVSEQVQRMTSAGHQPIILCSSQVRMHFQKMIERFLPDVVVLSYNEIQPNVKLKTEGMVTV